MELEPVIKINRNLKKIKKKTKNYLIRALAFYQTRKTNTQLKTTTKFRYNYVYIYIYIFKCN